MLLLLADDDRVVSPLNSTMFYDALKRSGIQAEMHVYPSGGHGWGMGKRFRYHEHFKAATIDWLKSIAN